MYADFFGLRELPFNNTPDPRFFYATPDHEEALASLIYTVQQRKGFMLLTGEAGTGKTLITKMMLRHFEGRIAFATVNHAVRSTDDLLEAVCMEFELPVEPGASQARIVRSLHDLLLAKFAQDVPAVLVLDEAQLLPVSAFEQLRTIGNLEADDAKLLQIIIVGQPELQRTLASPRLRQLAQRIFRGYHVPALTLEGTEGYIQLRLSVAGATDLDLFDERAVEIIHRESQGLPRLINTLCDNALVAAYSADCRRIVGPFMESVLEQMTLVRAQVDPEEPKAKPLAPQGPALGSSSDAGVPGPASVAPALSHPLEVPSPISVSELQRLATVAAADEAARWQRGCLEAIERINARVQRLESAADSAGGEFSAARRLSEALGTAVDQARPVLAELRALSTSLTGQENQLEESAGKLRRVIGQVRKAYASMQGMTARSNQIETRMEKLLERLRQQVHEVRHAARELEVKSLSAEEIPLSHVPTTDEDCPTSAPTADLLWEARDATAQLRAAARTKHAPHPRREKPAVSSESLDCDMDELLAMMSADHRVA